MPFCPRCRAEYREGIETCSTCNVSLVDSLEGVPLPLSEETVATLLEGKELAMLVRGDMSTCKEIHQALLDEQIPALMLPPDDDVGHAGLSMVLDVIIAEEDQDRAVAVLQRDWADMLKRDGLFWPATEEGVMACPACGSTAPLVDGCCPDCGLYLGDAEEDEASETDEDTTDD